MQILIKIWLTILILGMVYCFYMFYKSTLESKKLYQHAIRFKKVYSYRTNLINRIGVDVYKKIASYDEMMTSNKPLEDKYWVNTENPKDDNLLIENCITENTVSTENTFRNDCFFYQFGASHNHVQDAHFRNSETYKEGAVPLTPHISSKTIAPTTDANGNLQIEFQVEAQDN
ncbi:hypothetical protein [Gelatiniphilus marinus]|uniref:Uncharacterized protein n=1 Tax=Gelatiniphilus marinus TaxID=1759464 RepID=A0ABW5JTG8_9FLAO